MSEIRRKQVNRVYVPEIQGDLYNLLTAEGKRREKVNPEQVPFFKYKDVFLAAAFLGYQAKRRTKLPTGDKKREIRLDTFDVGEVQLLKAIAIAETGDVEILQDMGTILVIAEEYAFAGASDLQMQLVDSNGLPLWNLIKNILPKPTA